jgi:probable biosynthetic protein (TIGR04098 family)
MASFGENDRLQIVSSVARYGTSMVDGTCYLVPVDANDSARDVVVANAGLDAAIAAGVPAARLSNIFVKQFGGAEWLKKARPAHPGFLRIAEVPDPPDSYAITKQAEQTGAFVQPDAGWSPMTSGVVTREYRLLPDRDLNGAGLVYFANYPIFLDICERDVLATAQLPLSDSLIDRRTVLRRRSAYLNNASAKDTLRIEIEPWVRVESSTAVDRDGAIDLHLHVNCRMYRQSDNRLMMVSGVRKVVPSVDAGAISWWRPARGASRAPIGG